MRLVFAQTLDGLFGPACRPGLRHLTEVDVGHPYGQVGGPQRVQRLSQPAPHALGARERLVDILASGRGRPQVVSAPAVRRSRRIYGARAAQLVHFGGIGYRRSRPRLPPDWGTIWPVRRPKDIRLLTMTGLQQDTLVRNSPRRANLKAKLMTEQGSPVHSHDGNFSMLGGLGISAAGLGGLALVVSWLPFIGTLANVFGLVALVCAASAFWLAKKAGRPVGGAAVAGVILAVLGMLVSRLTVW